MPSPSIMVRDGSWLLMRASVLRQSYVVAQVSRSSRANASGSPCDQSSTTSASGNRVRVRRSRRSVSCASSMWIGARTTAEEAVSDMAGV